MSLFEKMPKALLIIATFISLVACQEEIRLKPLSKQSVILAFGDSLTRGVGAPAGQDYPSQLATLLDIQVINKGISGEVSADGLKRLPAILRQTQPDLVILIHGGNDILRKQDLGKTAANLQAMIELVRQHGADLIVYAVPKFSLIPTAAPFYRQVVEKFQIPFDDQTLIALEKDSSMKSDAVHFNDKGYGKLADSVVDILYRHGALDQLDN